VNRLMAEIVSRNNISGTYLGQEAFGSKPRVTCHSTPPGLWCQLIRHAELLTGRYGNPL